MKRYLKWFALTLPLLTSACHFKFTGPMLWAHGSSAALDICISLWIVNILFFCYLAFLIKGAK